MLFHRRGLLWLSSADRYVFVNTSFTALEVENTITNILRAHSFVIDFSKLKKLPIAHRNRLINTFYLQGRCLTLLVLIAPVYDIS